MRQPAVKWLVLGAGALLAWCAAAGPAAAITVVVAPAETTVTLGDTLSLRLETADAFTNLKGYQLIRGFDGTKLQFIGADAGDVLGGPGDHALLVYPTGPDTAWVDAAMLDGTTQTPGIFVFLKFVAIGKGDAPITCIGTELRDDNNVSTFPDCDPGLVHIVGPTPVRPMTWGRLKQIYK